MWSFQLIFSICWYSFYDKLSFLPSIHVSSWMIGAVEMKLWNRQQALHMEVFLQTKRMKRHWTLAVTAIMKMKLRLTVMKTVILTQCLVADNSSMQLKFVLFVVLWSRAGFILGLWKKGIVLPLAIVEKG